MRDETARSTRQPERVRHLRSADAGDLVPVPVRVEDWKHDAFVHRDFAPLIDDAASGALASTASTLLSPFAPIAWDRKRATALFGFDYAIESICLRTSANRITSYCRY